MATSLAPAETVSCSECGAPFLLAKRTLSEHRRRGMPDRCRTCRFTDSPTAEQIAAARRWWLEHFTLDELRSWPPIT